MARRLRHRPRNACQLRGIVTECHWFGREAACQLCSLVDLDAPATALDTGRLDVPDPRESAEAAFWAHLARRTDGGPSNPAQLAVWMAKQRDKAAAEVRRRVASAVIATSDLPEEAPY